ncbi:MAG: NAD(+) synthase [Verrucomicrobiota bacterium]|nr:NAD(+) synthase [Verrucomicrobiota bacterium]
MSASRVIRARLVQMEVLPGRPADNAARMLEQVRAARTDRVELLVFPEMAIPGCLIGDEWEREAFLRECESCARALVAASDRMIVVFGSVAVDWAKRNEDGRVRKYNALFAAHDRRPVAPRGGPYPFVIKKTFHPNYRQFDDSRHFCDLRKLADELGTPTERLTRPIRIGRLSLGCLLCEDAWDSDYSISPLEILSRRGVDLFVNISSSPFTLNKNHKRNRLYAAHARRFGRPLLYVNHTGIQNNGKTVFTFDGASCIYDQRGRVVSAASPFSEAQLTLDLPIAPSARLGETARPVEDDIAEVYRAIEYGTRKFLHLCGIKRVTVGVSGGIDSAVVAAGYRRILSPDYLLLVNMPGPFTSPTTIRLARELAANLGCFYKELPIRESVRLTRRQINGRRIRASDRLPPQRLELSGFMTENVQARDRSSRVLAAIAAAFGGVFTCNANKSEATVGYTTLYGDLCGYLANIADLWKMEVYALGRHLNRAVYRRTIIPAGIFDLTPSAELSAAQNVDTGQGDPLFYPYHDRLFMSWVERWNRTTPEEILEWYAAGRLEKKLGYAGRIGKLFGTPDVFIADLERWWNRYQGMGLVKRIQAPPILAVKRRAFGFDHRESLMGARYTRRYLALKAKLLG